MRGCAEDGYTCFMTGRHPPPYVRFLVAFLGQNRHYWAVSGVIRSKSPLFSFKTLTFATAGAAAYVPLWFSCGGMTYTAA